MSLATSFCGRPEDGWTNRNVLRSIAKLGGFIGRKRDGEPGWITLWRGWQFLLSRVEGFNLARPDDFLKPAWLQIR